MKYDNHYLLGLDDQRAGDTQLCGGKAATIHKMRSRFGEMFPGGFVLTVQANELPNDELSDELDMIRRVYGENVQVAVRSSATIEDGANHAFPGQFLSLLNVRCENLLDAVREVQQSANRENVLSYCEQNGIDTNLIKMAVLIMPMVGKKESAISGAIFTIDPETGCADNYISACAGHGDAEMSGIATPEIAVVRNKLILRRKPRANDTEYLLSEEKILELSQAASDVEKAMRELSPDTCYVDIEYVIDHGKISFVQVRPETVASFETGHFQAVDAKAGYNKILTNTGYGASRGTASGEAIYCDSYKDADIVTGNSIIFCRETTNHWESYMRRCAAIVTAYGGANGHTSVFAREIGIPCITGIGLEAMEALKKYTGKDITVDATSRIIYEGLVDKKHLIYKSSLPNYGGINCVAEDELFQISSSVDQTMTDENGFRWLKKPRDVTSPFLHEIHRQGCRFVTDMLGLPPVRDLVREGIYYISFTDAYGIIKRLQMCTDEELSEILAKWKNTTQELVHLSENLDHDFSIEKQEYWHRIFAQENGLMGISYSLFLVLSDRFEKALSEIKLPEPYYSRAHRCVPPGTPLTSAQKSIADFDVLLRKENPSDEEIQAYALRYRVTPNDCIEFDNLELDVDALCRDLKAAQGRPPAFFQPEQEEYCVNDPAFMLVHKNMRELVALKESTHHDKLYCQRLFIAQTMISKNSIQKCKNIGYNQRIN